MCAAANGRLEAVKFLLDKGADVHAMIEVSFCDGRFSHTRTRARTHARTHNYRYP